MKWLLIVTVMFFDGDRYTGPLTADQYTLDQCLIAAKNIRDIVDGRLNVLSASCVKVESI